MTTSPTNEPDKREAAIFDAAVQLPPEQRADYLAKACGGDPQLRQRVEALLQSNDQAGGSFLEPTPPAPGSGKTIVLSIPPTEKAGDKIGRYKLLQQIGEGGCGVVYMAEQEEPVRRRVALKVIKLGMDTKSVIARFEAERQALALMDHPNIAKVLDAGTTDNGRPFFVMELVRGIKITDYCDQNKLSTDERLKLFVQVCHAIQHAHQKGIIHRDIKPSNILVTLHDGVPVPKVIDFGIAKATQGRLTDQTLFTAFEQFIGTPAYMSPEQAEMSGLDIDTRSDIYSLGVMLYELLTGKTPFDAKALLASGLDAMRHTIREQEPARPSTRLSTMLNADLTTMANCRRTDAPKLIHILSGDLDWIVMKALEKDRTRRFETANGLAVDIQRYLNNEAVTARPPSTLYRLQKLVRRNKTAAVATAIVAAALVLSTILCLFLLAKERRANRRLVISERIQASLAKQAEAGRLLEEEKRKGAELGEKIGLAALYMTQSKLDEAEKEIGSVPLATLSNHISTAFMFNVFGAQHGRHGRWLAAATNFSKVVAIVPADFPGYYFLAPLLAELGDTESYRQHCERMLRQFAGTNDVDIASDAAKASLILPPPAANFATIGKFVDTALTAGTNHEHWPEIQFTKSLLDYRLGHYADAAERLQKWLDAGDQYHYYGSLVLLAMAQYQLKQTDKARDSLADAASYAQRKIPKLGEDTLGDRWSDWAIDHLLMREAQALVMPEKTAEAKKSDEHARELTALRARAILEARHGQWQTAAADLAAYDAQDAGTQGLWYELAAIKANSGDAAGYRKYCQTILARFGTVTDPAIARKVAKACLLLPTTGADLAATAKLAEVALPQDSEWREITKCLAEYRQGNFSSAATWAKQALARPTLDRRDAQAFMVLAMAQQRLNQPDDARVAFAKGAEILNTKFPKLDSGEDLGVAWVDCVIGHILMREAGPLIAGSPAANSQSK